MTSNALLFAAFLAQHIPGNVAAFLESRMGFSDSDLRRLSSGEVVTRKLPSENNREVALFGAVRIRAPRRRFLTGFRDIGAFMQSPHLKAIGGFGQPPVPEDLQALRVTGGDLDALRECQPGDCDVNLPASVIDELQGLEWSSPEIGQEVGGFVRRHLIDYVRNYLSIGNGALVVYAHKREPLPLREGFQVLLTASPYLFEYVPELHRHLEEFPDGRSPYAENFLYWSVEEFGLRPLTTVTHATVYDPPQRENRQLSVITLKQIYASHYFHAALKVLALVDGDAAASNTWLLYLDRSLFDTKVSGFKRRLAEEQLLGNLTTRLRSIRQAVEHMH